MNERDEASQRNLNESTFYIITHDDGGGARLALQVLQISITNFMCTFSLCRAFFSFSDNMHMHVYAHSYRFTNRI